MVVDENFKIVMIDRKAAKFCGVSSGQSQGKEFYSLFPGLHGSLFASELHEVLIAIGEKRCSRSSHNTLLDQFANAFGADLQSQETVQAISMRASRDGSNICGLIRIHFNRHIESLALGDAASPRPEQATDHSSNSHIALCRCVLCSGRFWQRAVVLCLFKRATHRLPEN